MKISYDNKLAQAALKVARETFDARNPKMYFLYKSPKDSYVFELLTDGVVAIKVPVSGPRRVTLSPKAFFATNPTVLIKTKDEKILLGTKPTMVPAKVKNLAEWKFIAEAKRKDYLAN